MPLACRRALPSCLPSCHSTSCMRVFGNVDLARALGERRAPLAHQVLPNPKVSIRSILKPPCPQANKAHRFISGTPRNVVLQRGIIKHMLSILYFGRRVSPAASLCAPACPCPATQVLPWAGPFTSFLVSKQASRRRPRRGQPPDLLSRPLGGAREPELYSRAGSVGGDRTGFASFSGRTAFGTYFPEVRGHF